MRRVKFRLEIRVNPDVQGFYFELNKKCQTTLDTTTSKETTMNNRLTRSTTDRYVAGVCGGIAETYNVDPAVVRIIFIVLTLMGFSGVLAYALMWWIIPEGPAI